MRYMPPFFITMFIKIVEKLCPKNKSKVGHLHARCEHAAPACTVRACRAL